MRLMLVLALPGAGCANHRPELFPIYNKSVEVGSYLEFDVRAADGDGDTLNFGIIGKPERAVFMPVGDNTARFQWTPNAADVDPLELRRDYSVTFQVTDGIDMDSETIIITVTLSQGSDGRPVFITPSDHTLDLDRSDRIEFNIQVRDDDSDWVDLWLESSIPGGQFNSSPGSKIATFSWIPTAQQIGERMVWGMRVGAQDQQNPPVYQNITILLRGGQPACDSTPPKLQHQALPDGRGSSDYLVSVTVSDLESSVQHVFLYWLVDLPDGDPGTFEVKFMDHRGGDSWEEYIPNPGLGEGQTATISYYICAVDDDDPAGEECDLRACAPAEGRYEFTAYPAGSQSCENDALESNNAHTSASPTEFDPSGECHLGSLKICPGDVDWYRIVVPAGHWVGAMLSYTSTYGLLRMSLCDQDGVTILAEGTPADGRLTATSGVMQAERTVYLEVAGDDSQVENRYDLFLEVSSACTNDQFEPNDLPGQARDAPAGDYPGLTCCGDPDWYLLNLNQGDRLEVSISFQHDSGDLDLWIFDSETVETAQTFGCENSLGCSTTETDDEQVIVESLPADDTYYIAVFPYLGARNSYRMMIDVMP